MADENSQADGVEDQDGCDGLCDHETALDEHEITGDEDLPAATGGVQE